MRAGNEASVSASRWTTSLGTHLARPHRTTARRQSGDGGRLEEGGHRDRDAERLAQPGDDLGSQDRISPQRQEVVLAPTRPSPKTSCQIPATNPSSGVRGGTKPLPRTSVPDSGQGRDEGLRQTNPPRLSGRSRRQRRNEHDPARQLVVGEALGSERAQLLVRRGAAVLQHDGGGDLLPQPLVRQCEGDRLGDGGVFQ